MVAVSTKLLPKNLNPMADCLENLTAYLPTVRKGGDDNQNHT